MKKTQWKKKALTVTLCMVVGMSSVMPSKAEGTGRATPVKCSECGGTAYEYSQEDGLYVEKRDCNNDSHVPECRLTITYVEIYNVTECLNGHVTKTFSGQRELSRKHIGYAR